MWPHRWWPTRLPHPWDSPGKNTGVGCHFLLQGIIPTPGLNVVSCITGRFFITKPPGKEESILWKWLYYQCNLQIQCNLYQSTNGIFHRTGTKNFTIHMETQKTLNSQSCLEKKEWSWGNQTSNGIFRRTETKKFTIHMETQKTLSSQRSLEKEEWNWRNQPAWLQAPLQSYSHQDSIVLAQRQKYRSMEQKKAQR